MELLNRQITGKVERPIKVLQFGEGVFLRAFVDYMIDIANENSEFNGDIVIVKPIEAGTLEGFAQQECQYTVKLRGIVNDEVKSISRIVTSVTDAVDAYKEYEKYAAFAKLPTLRFLVSNITDGIVYDATDRIEYNPPKTYPGKLTKFLYERYQHFHGATDKGLIILPVELVEDNGKCLKECVLKLAKLWKLEEDFLEWIHEACIFTSTLIDRIVSGYPKDEEEEFFKEFGYQDKLMVTGEPFALWVIESEVDLGNEFPLPKAGLPVVFTDNQKPYKLRKARILNGAHTSFALASYLCGNDIVLESMDDVLIRNFIKYSIYDEIIPTLALPKQELLEFADTVLARFSNPYVKHSHLAIATNSISKWNIRCLPSFLGYIDRTGKAPDCLSFSLAAMLAFYTGTKRKDQGYIGHRGQEVYQIEDDAPILDFFAANSSKDTAQYVHAVLQKEEFWGKDLSTYEGVEEKVTMYLENIRTHGMRRAIELCMEGKVSAYYKNA